MISQRTLCFLTKDNQVLLGLKKRGFGEGKYAGIGGKLEEGETIQQATIRETEEEIGVTPTSFKQIGIMTFLFPYVETPDKWNQEVYVFVVDKWDCQIIETDEIKPEWFDKDMIPLGKMWSDAKYWLPEILNGKQMECEFVFDKDLEVEKHTIKYIN